MKNAVFGKTKKNVGKHRGIKIETTGDRKNNLVSEPNYQARKTFLEKTYQQ